MNRTLGWIIGAVALTCGASEAALLPYPEPGLKYPAFTYKDTELKNYWKGWLQRFVVGGVIQGNDPSGVKKPISEGQSYGMLLAVWMNDQKAFDEIWKATESKFWNASKGWYKWDPNNPGGGDNFAGDADQDICAALIMASALVDKNHWTDNGYKAKAKTVLQSLDKNFFDGNGYVYSWPGENGTLNPSYHMPAYHPMFKEFGDANGVSIDWTKRSSAAFALMNAQPSSASGIARNFSNSSGGTAGGNSTPTNYDMGFDAIRVPYRMGMAALWYPDKFPQAVSWCKSVWNKTVVNPREPGMYKIDQKTGDVTLWGWALGAEQYEKFMPRAMWGTAAIAVASKDANSKAAFEQIARDFSGSHAKPDQSYLSGTSSETGTLTSPDMNYYGQSLGLMGALVLYGRAWNVWDDLKNPWVVPDTGASFKVALTATPASIEQTPTGVVPVAGQTTKITATLSKSVPWTLRLKGRTSGASFSTTGTGTEINVEWYSLRRSSGTTKAFEVEMVDARLIYNGVDTVSNPKCKATITVTKNSAVAPRSVRGNGMVRWTAEGLEIEDAAWQAGDRVQVKVLDLTGRTLQAANVELTTAKIGVRVSARLEASPGIQVLELSNGAVSRRYLLSPNP